LAACNPASAFAAVAAEQAPATTSGDVIVVTGEALYRGIRPDRELDENGIASYGVSTVDELLDEVGAELGEDPEPPLILVNGERINDSDEIGALPVEVLRNVQVLPRGSAVRSGGTPGQRVISLTLQRKVRTATLTAASKVATDGDWHSNRGEAMLTSIDGPTTINVTLRGRDDSDLLESDRNIIQPAPTLAYALAGNVIGYPNTSGEIDPALSALAGQLVTVAPIPSTTNPTLGDFAAGANQPAVTDLGRFRTLRPSSRNYELNGTFGTRLTPWLTGRINFTARRSLGRSERGLPSALFVVSPANAFSPFANNVGVAVYGRDPLISRSTHDSGEGNLSLNARFGQWTGNLYARYAVSKDETHSDRQTSFGPIVLGNSVDPFGADLTDLIAIQTDLATSHSTTDLLQLNLYGPALKLPAGNLQATIEGHVTGNRLRSQSSFSLFGGERRFHRTEESIRGAIEIPITSRANNFLPGMGDLSATAEFTRVHYSDAGTLDNDAVGLLWEPRPFLQLSADLSTTRRPAAIQLLGGPVIVTQDLRTFDPLTGQTVDVTQISGGIPDLQPETIKFRRIGAQVRLVPRLNLLLNADYTDTDTRNFISSLPEASAAVMLAFPERFVRDGSGTLTTIDLRPVNFASQREKRLRYGFSLSTTLGGERKPIVRAASPAGPGPAARAHPPLRLQLNLNHSIVFSDTIVIRPSLDPVDLLGGGAIGIAGGRVRHQLDGTASLTSGGTGVRVAVSWRGKSTLESTIGGIDDTLRFSPVLSVNLRAFADMHRFFPRATWAQKMRVSLNLLNATNDRQEVRDSAGNTPRQYQPGYRDAIGRTIELEIRKTF
jgi:iron complex outermembrane receptor protein